ncbi:MAG: hypothetical protein U1E78_05710 [Gammaproteobacteria bacterium]
MHSNSAALGLTYSSKPENLLTGLRVNDFYEGGEIIGTFICVGEKDVGLNPGFFALSMNEAFHKQVRNLLIEKLQENSRFFLERLKAHQMDKLGTIAQLLKPDFFDSEPYQRLLQDPICQNSLISDILSKYNQSRIELRCYIAKRFVESDPFFEMVLEDHYFSKALAITELSNPLPHTSASYTLLLNHPLCRQKIIDAFKIEVSKLAHIEKFIFKYDFQLSRLGLAVIPLSNFFLETDFKRFYHRLKLWVGNRMSFKITLWRARWYQLKSAMTTEKANQSAVLSCLATDLARSRGLKVPELKLARAQYPNGKLKLLVFSEWSDDFKKINNTQLIVKPKFDLRGLVIPEQFHTDSSLLLGQSYIMHLTLMTLFGDRSHFGIEGCTFYGFDLGGCSISYQAVLKNLSPSLHCQLFEKRLYVYSDTPLTSKMQSLYLLNKIRTGTLPSDDILSTLPSELIETLYQIKQDNDLGVIDAYIEQFPEYTNLLRKLKSDLVALDKGILKIVTDRIHLTPLLLTLLENLEKLCSPTTVSSNEGFVIFHHLKVDSKRHTIWQVAFQSDRVVFMTTKVVKSILSLFFQAQGPLQFDFHITANTLTISQSDIEQLSNILNESAIATYQGFKTASMLEEDRLIIQEEDYDRLANSHTDNFYK